MDELEPVHSESIKPGEKVYDESGRLLGQISGLTEQGFETETMEPGVRDEEDIPGQELGKGYLMWRCTECGAMGKLEDGFPETCPECSAGREAISEMVED